MNITSKKKKVTIGLYCNGILERISIWSNKLSIIGLILFLNAINISITNPKIISNSTGIPET